MLKMHEMRDRGHFWGANESLRCLPNERFDSAISKLEKAALLINEADSSFFAIKNYVLLQNILAPRT